MLPAPTLAGDDVTVVIEGTSRIAVAMLASVPSLGQPPVLGKALVAVPADDVAFAGAFAGVDVAALVVDGAQRVARARLAPVRVVHVEVPKTVFADITASAFHVGFAMTAAGHEVVGVIGDRVADAVV